MSATSRTKQSIKNSSVALFEQIIYNLLSFISRTVFIYTLNRTYLGINGLFNDILTLLSLGELGIGTAIIYSMYKPAAKDDYESLSALLNLYKKIYTIIGTVLTVVGLCLTPFLDFFISDMPTLEKLPLIYILYLGNTTGSYFFIYKKSILIVDQRSDIVSIISILTNTLKIILQILMLIAYQNFIQYLLIQLLFTLLNNIAISLYVDHNYSYLKKFKKAKVDSKTRNQIYTNVKAMFLSKLSSAVVTSTDNILISKYVSTVALGLYSNYTLFSNMLRTFISKIFEALTGSIGNLVATEKANKIYGLFRDIWFVNFWIVGFCSASLFILINPFIELWIGPSYLMDIDVVVMIVLNLYMRLIRNTFLIFADTYGLFVELRWKSICEAIINIIVSLFFVGPMQLGITGILLGTFVSNIATNFWYEPYLLFVKRFRAKLLTYFFLYLKYLIVTITSIVIVLLIENIVEIINPFFHFIFLLSSCIIVINGFFAIVFFKTSEFKFLIKKLFRKKGFKYDSRKNS